MLFDVICRQIVENSYFLNEPRVLYMSGDEKGLFDIWSKSAFFDSSHHKINFEPNVENYLKNVKIVLPEKCEIYIEKMPEHALRTTFFDMMDSLGLEIDQYTIERCWVDVATSISKFCVQDWYGYGSVKWRAILAELANFGLKDPILNKYIAQELQNWPSDREISEIENFQRGALEWFLFKIWPKRPNSKIIKYEKIIYKNDFGPLFEKISLNRKIEGVRGKKDI